MRRALTAALLALALSAPAAAAQFFLEPPTTSGDGGAAQEAGAISALIRQALLDDGHELAAVPAAGIPVLRTRITRQDGLYSVLIEKIVDGQVVHSASTAPQPLEALEKELESLVRAASS